MAAPENKPVFSRYLLFKRDFIVLKEGTADVSMSPIMLLHLGAQHSSKLGFLHMDFFFFV